MSGWVNAFVYGDCAVTVICSGGQFNLGVLPLGRTASFINSVDGNTWFVTISDTGTVSLYSNTAVGVGTLAPGAVAEVRVTPTYALTGLPPRVRAITLPTSAQLSYSYGAINTGSSGYVLFSAITPAAPDPMDLSGLGGSPTYLGVHALARTDLPPATLTLDFTPEVYLTTPVLAADATLAVSQGSAANAAPISFTQGGSAVSATPNLVSAPTHGSATVTGLAIAYTPLPGFVGADTFTYNGSYGGVTSNTATVSITVNATPNTVTLRWTDDGGHNWSNRLIASAGFIGQTAQRVKWNRLGSTRRNSGLDRIFEVAGDDYTQVALIGASLDED
jgi:hypothetical protein